MMNPDTHVDEKESRFVNERMGANIQKDGTYTVIPREGCEGNRRTTPRSYWCEERGSAKSMGRAGKVELAVFRTSNGAIYAVENRSPHPKGGPLAEGIVSGYYLYDPLYDWKIDLRTGEVQAPDRGNVVTYPVTLKGETVTVSI